MTPDHADCMPQLPPDHECGHVHPGGQATVMLEADHRWFQTDDYFRAWGACDGRRMVDLAIGTLLRLDAAEQLWQGCAGAEDEMVWSRFHVLSGAYAGCCIEIRRAAGRLVPPWDGKPVIPPVFAPIDDPPVPLPRR